MIFSANCSLELCAQVDNKVTVASNPAADPAELETRATKVLNDFCIACHGPDRQEGEVRLDVLESLDPVDRQHLFRDIQQVAHLSEMPPADANQPTVAERKLLLQWVSTQLNGKAAKALAEKLLRFEYGNVVDH